MGKPESKLREERASRESKDSKSPRRSWLFWLGSRLLVVAVLFGILAYFAPLLITSTGIWRQGLAQAVPELAPQIKVDGLDLSWFAPVEIRGLSVVDGQGHPLAAVPRLRSEKSLLGLALNLKNLGKFVIDEPKLTVILRPDGSNLEDLLAKLPKSESKSEPLGIEVQISNAAVEYHDLVAGRQWVLESANLEFATTLDQQIRGKVASAVRLATPGLSGPNSTAGQPGASGQLTAAFAWQPGGAAQGPAGAGEVSVDMRSAPTELLEGAIVRFAGDIRPRGSLDLRAAAGWNGTTAVKLKIEQLASSGLGVRAPQLLGSDQPSLAIGAFQADLELAGPQLTIRSLDLQTNLVRLTGKGAMAGSPAAAQDVDLNAQVNLAELSRQLPATLHLRGDTQLQSGIVEVNLASAANAGWRGSLKTRDLRGSAGGRPVQFERPLELNFAVRQTPQGPVIDNLVGEASFLRLEGQGSLSAGGISAKADLDKLVAELGRVIDWGDLQLTGSLVSDVRWRQEANADWTANADLQVQNFVLTAPQMMPWKEPQLQLTATVRGLVEDSSLAQINGANVTISAGEDKLQAALTEVVKAPSTLSVWPVKFGLQGNLASWTPRVQPFVALGDWRLAGATELTGTARVALQEIEFAQTSLQLSQLVIEGPAIAIREPVVKVETAGAWSQPNATLTLGTTTLASSAVAFRADGVRVVASNEPSLVGTIDLRGDLGRLSSWLGGSQQPATSQIAGGLTGRLEIGYRGQALAANWNADVENFKYLVARPPATHGAGGRAIPVSATRPGWQPAWEEQRVNITGQASYDPATGTLKVERAGGAAAVGSFAATGTVTNLGGAMAVDLTGELAYDLALVAEQIKARAKAQAGTAAPEAPYGLDTLQLTGKQKRQFVLKGPLLAATPVTATNSASLSLAISDALTGEASLGWEGAQYVGLVAGPADFRARLASGILNIGPLDIPLSEGRLTTAPRVLINDPARPVAIDRGPVLENVRISPEMCSLWLKYVAPLVADATRAEGKFSLSLENANVPLTMPLASSVEGALNIQTAQIGPGPLAQQYLGVIRQLRGLLRSDGGSPAATEQNGGWVILPEQNVVFSVRNGVVTNRGLTMSVGDAVITTEGTVNIETQQINLVASVPLNESWFKQKDGVFAVLKGQTVKIPIDGTLTQPRLDTRALQSLGTQAAGSALKGALNKQVERGQGLLNKELERGQGALQQELNQGLNRLFGPRPPTAPQPTTPQPPATQPR